MGTAAVWWLLLPEMPGQSRAQLSPIFPPRWLAMAAEDVGGAEGTVAGMGKKAGLFLPSEDPAQQSVVLAQHAGAARSVS